MRKNIVLGLTLLFSTFSYGQWYPEDNQSGFSEQNFWEKVRFGGGIGLGFGDGYTNLGLAPSALYEINNQFAAGVGLQYNYTRLKNDYSSSSYGVNLLGTYNPIPQFQFSLELEQLRVNNKIDAYSFNGNYYPETKSSFWNTALFVGAGFSSGNATIGIKYNLLFNKNDRVYADSWMPFVRFYF